MGQDDSPNSHVREEFIKETKSGIYSSILEAMFSSECPFYSFLNHIYSGGVDLSPILIAIHLCIRHRGLCSDSPLCHYWLILMCQVSRVADHRSRDSRMAEALTLGPINRGSVLCSLMPHQWKLAGLIAFQGQPDGHRSFGWPFDIAHAYSTTSNTAEGITAQQERTNDGHQDETKTTTKSTNSTSTNNPNDLHVVPFLPVAIYTKWVQGVGAHTGGFASSSAGSGTKRALLSSPDCYNSLRKTSESN
ncbi:hypothetical protein T08_6269 [Trichinella sp. T8]|nr:hypothetical protein T08_6269 [Trichinella sp. T8]